MNRWVYADLPCGYQSSSGVLLDTGDLEAVPLVESLNVLEGTVQNAEPACEVHQVLVA